MAQSNTTKKSLAEQRWEAMQQYDKEMDELRRIRHKRRPDIWPPKPQDEECMTELIVDAGEVTYEDLDIMGIDAAMCKYKSLKRALKEYPNITAEVFKKNIVRVMRYQSWNDFVEKWGDYLDT